MTPFTVDSALFGHFDPARFCLN